jgi:hypothetical protein
MKGFKAFDKGLKCNNFQYEENTEYSIKDEPILCKKGFHYCENPLDVLDYYSLCDSEFAEIESLGETKTDGQKTVTNHIKIKAKLDLNGFIKASVNFLWEKCSKDADKKNYSQLASSGENSICAAIGKDSIAKGIIGNWIVLSEFDDKGKIICVKSAKIDGKKLKANTFYKLKNKKFIEVK